MKLLVDLGGAVADYQDKALRNLNAKRVQADEIWSFCYAKKKTVQKDQTILERNPDAGDVWTWTALDAESKLCISWIVGSRDSHTATAFMKDIESRLANRVQLTTDQLSIYLRAVDTTFKGKSITRCSRSCTRADRTDATVLQSASAARKLK